MEWTELKIDNLPPDILTGDYDFSIRVVGEWTRYMVEPYVVIKSICNHSTCGYRKPEPKAPTHPERMTKWFLDDEGYWVKSLSYEKETKLYELRYNYELKDWFTGRESADIPPEDL